MCIGDSAMLRIIAYEVLVANEWSDLAEADIVGPKRTPRIVAARSEVAYLLKKLSVPIGEISELLGKRHATVIHDIRAIDEQVSASSETAAKLKAVLKRVQLKLENRKDDEV